MPAESKARIYRQSSGSYRLDGELDFDSVPAVLEQSRSLFREEQADMDIDLGGLQRGNSAALGLMLEWMRLAGAWNRKVHYHNVPDDLLAVAKVSDLDSILPLRY